MKNARELMLEYTAFSFRDPKKAAEMFAEDGAFELPYLATFGLPTEYRGRDAIAAFFGSLNEKAVYSSISSLAFFIDMSPVPDHQLVRTV